MYLNEIIKILKMKKLITTITFCGIYLSVLVTAQAAADSANVTFVDMNGVSFIYNQKLMVI